MPSDAHVSIQYTLRLPNTIDLRSDGHPCRRRGYSYRTEHAYTSWTRRDVRFHDTTHPRDLGADAVRTFLNHLATERGVAASTQNQALNALVFLY